MPIKINVGDRIRFKVVGRLRNEAGAEESFDFTLAARRLEAQVLRDRLAPNQTETVDEFLLSVVDGWAGVRDDANAEVPFSPEALTQLLRIPGLGRLAFEAYVIETGARAKN
jgi:hypothetical protein